MKNKILGILVIFFLVFNTGMVINSSGNEQIQIRENEKIPLNDINLEPIKGNEEELSQIEQESLTILSDGKKGSCAIVIKQFLPHSLGMCMKNTCDFAIKILQKRGYNNILYINSPTLKKLSEDMIEFVTDNLGNQKRIFIYLTAHGSSFGDEGSVQINPFQMLRDDMLASYINSFPSYYSICTVVMESCEVGSFIDDLSGSKRIIITATDSDSSSYGTLFGLSPFSEKILNSYGAGDNLKVAWENADAYIYENQYSLYGQNPQLDDNGNGYSVGNYDEADILPMDDGYTSNPNNWDGNLAATDKKTKQKFNLIDFRKTLLNKMFDNLLDLGELIKKYIFI